jgi:hypothetical protein
VRDGLDWIASTASGSISSDPFNLVRPTSNPHSAARP